MSKTRRWLVLATVSAGLLMVSVDTTVLYTALPTLTADLQADATQKLWIINAYPLVMAGLLLGAGTLGDGIGHKRMYLTGLVLFAAASLLAAFAPSPPVLIAARAFLAVGAAAMLPATAALIRITFDDEHERGIAIGVWGTMAVLGAALGPITGGLLLQHFWWGSVFLLNIPVVLLALAATAAFVPGGSGHRDRPWDLIASLQAMIALAGLVYAIQEASSIESVSYELGSLAGVTVLGTILTAVYTNTIRLPATAPPGPPAASTKPAPPPATSPPAKPAPC
jgi:DHA2 family multidrug resistance protein-like MFS transporter